MSPAEATQKRTGNLVAAIAAVSACDIAFGLTLQLIPLLMEREGWPAWAIGLNAAMAPVGILLAGPFMPRILGNSGTKRAAFVIVAILVASLVAISMSPFWMWFPLRFIFGMATSALFTISETWVLTFSTEQNRGRIMAFYTSVLAVTFSVGPLILPWTGIEGFLPWGIGIFCIVLSILPLTFVKVAEDAFHQKEGAGFFGFVRRAPLLLFAVGAATLFDNVLISFFTIYGLRHGVELDVASRILGVGIIGNVLMMYPMGWLADHWSRKGVIILSAITTIVLSLSLLVVINHWIVWPVMMLLTAAAFGVYMVALATMGDSFKGPDLISGAAAIAAMWGVGGLIGPPVAGVAIDLFGINAMPVTLASFYVILLVGVILSGGRLVREPSHG
ncbi:MFS transporter [Aestuariivirga sp.]|uniref:MFS transporter n=1 Tax=Aestuariivirga sp. TaxID=2650926 RepID=UPI0035944EC5